MIGPPSGVRIWLACGVTDLRNGFDGLAAIVQTQLSEHPYSGQLFAFRAVTQAFAEKAYPIAAVPQHFHFVAAAAAKDKNMSRVRTLMQRRLYQRA
jgi:hypothetical protein